MIETPTPVTLNIQTVNQLLEQTSIYLNQEDAGENQKTAMLNLQAALQAVLPFLPQTPEQPIDEVRLENDIREEIVIAGANENG